MIRIEYSVQKVIAKIHLDNIRFNAETFSALTNTKLCAVVKANAYGHGAEEVVHALADLVDTFAVALIDEGLAIRGASCGRNILVFTPPTSEEEAFAMAVNGFTATVDGLKATKLVLATCHKFHLRLKVHLKVNTGMNRYGMNGSMLGKVCKLLQGDPYVEVKGIYSHLYTHSSSVCEEQRQLFLRMLAICKRYFPNVNAHLGATYGALLGKDYAFDMMRIGLGLYGYLPCSNNQISLKKGMTIYAKTVANRKYSFGGVGYGSTSMQKGEYVRICRFGYADGFLRTRDIDEKRANDLCMDVSMEKGREVLGKYVPILTDADEIAKRSGTIAYEVLCAATRRAEFIYD